MFLYSEKLNELGKALSLAQSQFKTIPKSGENPHFKSKFSTYNDIKHGTDEALAANGLSVSHYPISDNGEVGVATVLLHSSGQFILSRLMMKPSRPGPQEAGSIITYFKRYGRASVLGIEGEIDDDGNSESLPPRQEKPAASQEVRYDYNQPTQAAPKAPNPPAAAAKPDLRPNPAKAGEPISEAQGKRLFALSKSAGWDINEVKDFLSLQYGYSSTKEILRKDYEKICGYIQSNSPQDALRQLGLERAGDDRNAPPPFTDSDVPF